MMGWRRAKQRAVSPAVVRQTTPTSVTLHRYGSRVVPGPLASHLNRSISSSNTRYLDPGTWRKSATTMKLQTSCVLYTPNTNLALIPQTKAKILFGKIIKFLQSFRGGARRQAVHMCLDVIIHATSSAVSAPLARPLLCILDWLACGRNVGYRDAVEHAVRLLVRSVPLHRDWRETGVRLTLHQRPLAVRLTTSFHHASPTTTASCVEGVAYRPSPPPVPRRPASRRALTCRRQTIP